MSRPPRPPRAPSECLQADRGDKRRTRPMTPCIGPYSPVAASWLSSCEETPALGILGRFRPRPQAQVLTQGMPFHQAAIRSAVPVDGRTQCSAHARTTKRTSALSILGLFPPGASGCRPSSRLAFPHRQTLGPPVAGKFGTQDCTQTGLTLEVGRLSVICGDWPWSR